MSRFRYSGSSLPSPAPPDTETGYRQRGSHQAGQESNDLTGNTADSTYMYIVVHTDKPFTPVLLFRVFFVQQLPAVLIELQGLIIVISFFSAVGKHVDRA